MPVLKHCGGLTRLSEVKEVARFITVAEIQLMRNRESFMRCMSSTKRLNMTQVKVPSISLVRVARLTSCC